MTNYMTQEKLQRCVK